MSIHTNSSGAARGNQQHAGGIRDGLDSTHSSVRDLIGKFNALSEREAPKRLPLTRRVTTVGQARRVYTTLICRIKELQTVEAISDKLIICKEVAVEFEALLVYTSALNAGARAASDAKKDELLIATQLRVDKFTTLQTLKEKKRKLRADIKAETARRAEIEQQLARVRAEITALNKQISAEEKTRRDALWDLIPGVAQVAAIVERDPVRAIPFASQVRGIESAFSGRLAAAIDDLGIRVQEKEASLEAETRAKASISELKADRKARKIQHEQCQNRIDLLSTEVKKLGQQLQTIQDTKLVLGYLSGNLTAVMVEVDTHRDLLAEGIDLIDNSFLAGIEEARQKFLEYEA